jgi:hypothetical protein
VKRRNSLRAMGHSPSIQHGSELDAMPRRKGLLLRGIHGVDARSQLTAVVDAKYTTAQDWKQERIVAFLRRKGNAFYLVHNVRKGGRVKQLHLAKLGERPRITDEIVRQVSRSHPFVDVNWSQLREQVNNRVELFDPESDQVQRLVSNLRNLNLDLADLFPPLLDISQAPEAGLEIIMQLRLLHSTVGVKLDQFDRSPRRGVWAARKFR